MNMDGKDNIMLNEILNDPTLFDDGEQDAAPLEQVPTQEVETPQEGTGETVDTADISMEDNTAVDDRQAQHADGDNVEPTRAADDTGLQQPEPPVDTNQALLMQMIAGQQKQIEEMQNLIKQQSRASEQATVEQMQQQSPQQQPPAIDFNELLYADDDTRVTKQQEWVNGMTEFVKQTALKDMEPVLNDYRETKQRQAYETAAAQLKAVPGMGEKLGGAIDGAQEIINQVPALKQLDPSDALVIGALVAKGKESLNAPTPKAKTAEELAKEVMANPQAMKIIATHNAEQLKSNQNIPPLAAGSGGMSPAPIHVGDEPQTLEEGLKFLDELL